MIKEEVKTNRESVGDWPIRIVPLEEKHIPVLAVLEAESFSDPWSEQAYRDLLHHDYCHYLVAEDPKGYPVGFAGMTVSFDEADIDKVMVAGKARRRGIADSLLKEVMGLGKELGVKNFTLEVRKGNLPALALYEKNGFVSEGIRPNFYSNPKEDAVILWKRGRD